MAKHKQSRMKTAVRGFGRTFLNVPGWLGVASLKEPTKELIKRNKHLYSTPTASNKETFDQAVKRLNLTENDLQQRLATLQWQALLSLAMALMVLVYTLYLFWIGDVAIGLLSLGVTSLFFLRFLSSRFWITQIKQRRLGLSFSKWLTGKIRGQQDA